MFSRDLPERADVVIVGAGVVGLSVARELSRYDVEVVVLEKETDVGLDLSSKNMGVIHPFIPQSRTNKFNLCIEGNKLFDELSRELSFPFKRTGLLIVALNFLESLFLRFVKIWLRLHGIKYISVDKKKLRELEPNINRKARYALFIPTAGITDPIEYSIALAENAVANGAKIILDCEVKSVEKKSNMFYVKTSCGIIRAKAVINAGGLYSDEIMKISGQAPFEMEPGLGVMLIMDAKRKTIQNHLVAEVPLRVDPRTKGGAAGITVYGKLIWGPNLRDVEDKRNEEITKEDIYSILRKFNRLFPNISDRDVIYFFSGVRPATKDGNFIIAHGETKGIINVAGIQSPGLTASPAIAKRVVNMLKEMGFNLIEKEEFKKERMPIEKLRDMDIDEIRIRSERDAGYRRVICNEIPISEKEILEAINRGARTVKSVFNRIGLGWHPIIQMECAIRVAEILSRETGKPLKDILFESLGTELGVMELWEL